MKRAIVTGGSGLIGQAICSALLDEGWEVASFDLKEGAIGQQIHCDLASEESVVTPRSTSGTAPLAAI
jgi:NAD(P)-dependent dehydrogenase (short-subunit alcohol dehydrogenase family)